MEIPRSVIPPAGRRPIGAGVFGGVTESEPERVGGGRGGRRAGEMQEGGEARDEEGLAAIWGVS